VETLERVLQRTITMGRGHGHVPYEERWRELVQSLVKKRIRSNMAGAYLYLKRRYKDV